MPRVSVGLPVYNGERFIEQSIRSVLDQTFTDLELIVSDNASTDRTVEIVEKFAAGDDRVVLLRHDVNRGAASNYNATFERASGELFRWHAHDDWFEPRLLERLVAALDADPGAVLAHSWTRFVDDEGTTTRIFEDDLGVTSDRQRDRVPAVVRRLTYCNAVFGLIRREVLERTALIAPFPGSDVSLLYELAAHGRFAVVPEPLFVRRPGASNKANPSNRQIAEWFHPAAKGRRLPSLHLWWASVTAIWRSHEPVRERVATLVGFHRIWPIDQARRLRRRRARKTSSP